MVEMQLEYLGNLNVKAVHGPSGTEITTAAPVDNHGDGSSFSPTDLFTTSLGSCILTILAIKAREEGMPFEKVKARVEKHMATDPRRVGKIRIDFFLEDEYTEAQKARLQQLCFECPVCRSLDPEIELDFEYNFA